MCMSVPIFSKICHFELFNFFCEILSRLRKNVEVMLAFRVILEGHFGAPQNCKSWALVRTRAQFWQFSLTFFLLLFFLLKILKKHENWVLVRTRARFLQFWGGSKMSLQEHSERQGECMWSQVFPKMRQDFTKSSKVQKCWLELPLTCRWNNEKNYPIFS